MALFLQYVVNGLASGSVIALLALSVVLVYRSTRVLSFAQGAIASLSTYVYYQLFVVWGWPAVIAMPVALGASVGLGAFAAVGVIRPLRRADALTKTTATLGLVLVLQVIMRVGWKGSETFLSPLAKGRLAIGSFTISVQEIIIAVVAIGAAVALTVWSARTYRGLGLWAMAQDRDSSRLLGVDPERATVLAWSVSAVLAALAGILVTPLLVLNPWQMTLIMVVSYGAALVGGFTSLPLALLGGALIGVVQSVTTGYVNVSGLSEALGFIAVFAVLLMSRGRRAQPLLLGQGAEL